MSDSKILEIINYYSEHKTFPSISSDLGKYLKDIKDKEIQLFLDEQFGKNWRYFYSKDKHVKEALEIINHKNESGRFPNKGKKFKNLEKFRKSEKNNCEIKYHKGREVLNTIIPEWKEKINTKKTNEKTNIKKTNEKVTKKVTKKTNEKVNKKLR